MGLPKDAGSDAPRHDTSTGLDRAAFEVCDKFDSDLVTPLQESRQALSPDASSSDEDQVSTHSDNKGFANIRRVSGQVRAKARVKAKKILHTSGQNKVEAHPNTPTLAPPPANEADNDRLFHATPEHKGPQAKDLLHHPVETVQSVMHGASGEKMAAILDNQTIAHGADVNLVQAHNKVDSAKSNEEKQLAIDDLEKLKEARQDTYVRWTMDRHVLKVRRLPPHKIHKPLKKDFTVTDQEGKTQTEWTTYGQHLVRFYARQYGDQYIDESPYLPSATEEAINTSLERLLMASMPYQIFLMKIRHIYRWENPIETAMWLASYIIAWAVDHLAGAAILTIIWLVAWRHLFPPTIEDLRQSIKRSEDVEQTATNFTQLIEQHGSRGWVDALIKDLGPRALIQIEDMADALEIIRNFYEWRSPRRTFLSLAILSSCWIYLTVTPLRLLIKTTQLTAALVFFGLFPISSLFPHYRTLVSPLTWLFWKIPTDAEWAIARLQAEAHRSKRVEPHDDDNQSCDQADQDASGETSRKKRSIIDIGRYHCTSLNHHGDLHVTSEGVRYFTAVRSTLLWDLRFEDVKTIRKTKSNDGIVFTVMDGSNLKVMGLKLQQQVFTQIIGYSDVIWQVTN